MRKEYGIGTDNEGRLTSRSSRRNDYDYTADREVGRKKLPRLSTAFELGLPGSNRDNDLRSSDMEGNYFTSRRSSRHRSRPDQNSSYSECLYQYVDEERKKLREFSSSKSCKNNSNFSSRRNSGVVEDNRGHINELDSCYIREYIQDIKYSLPYQMNLYDIRRSRKLDDKKAKGYLNCEYNKKKTEENIKRKLSYSAMDLHSRKPLTERKSELQSSRLSEEEKLVSKTETKPESDNNLDHFRGEKSQVVMSFTFSPANKGAETTPLRNKKLVPQSLGGLPNKTRLASKLTSISIADEPQTTAEISTTAKKNNETQDTTTPVSNRGLASEEKPVAQAIFIPLDKPKKKIPKRSEVKKSSVFARRRTEAAPEDDFSQLKDSIMSQKLVKAELRKKRMNYNGTFEKKERSFCLDKSLSGADSLLSGRGSPKNRRPETLNTLGQSIKVSDRTETLFSKQKKEIFKKKTMPNTTNHISSRALGSNLSPDSRLLSLLGLPTSPDKPKMNAKEIKEVNQRHLKRFGTLEMSPPSVRSVAKKKEELNLRMKKVKELDSKVRNKLLGRLPSNNVNLYNINE